MAFILNYLLMVKYMVFKSIANRIFILVVPTVIVTSVSFAALSYNVSVSRINQTLDEKMHECLTATDLQIQLELNKNASVAKSLSDYGKTMSIETFDHKVHENHLADVIKSNKNTFGGGVWFEPYKFDKSSYYFGPFLYIDENGEIHYTHDYADYADYFSTDWYLKGKNSDGAIAWSKVYYDPFSEITMVTASMPFYNEDGKFIGMGTADMNVEKIREIVNSISVGETGRAFIIGASGEYISFYDEEKNVNNTIQTDVDRELASLGKEILENESGTSEFSSDGQKQRVYYTTMDDTNWTIAVTMAESEIRSSTMSSFIVMTIIPAIGLVLIILAVAAIINYLVKIINKVNAFADLASSGNFSERIDVTEVDEFGIMEQRLNSMIASMSDMSGKSQEMLEQMEITERLLHAVNAASAALLASDEEEFEESLRDGMELMARCMDVDRIYIWQNNIIDGVLYYEQIHEWLSEAGKQSDTVRSVTKSPRIESIPEWEFKFMKGNCVNGPLANLSDNEVKRLAPFGVKAILIVPVYFQEHYWGFVSFDDCRTEREFTEDEVGILRSASLMIASAINRNEAEARMREADERAKLMLDATPLSCCLIDEDFNIIDCNEEAVKLYGMKDKQEYLSKFFSTFPKYQPDGQLSIEKARKLNAEAFETGLLVFEFMQVKPDGEPIPSEVTIVRVKRGNDDVLACYNRDLREYKKMTKESEYKDTLLRTVNKVATLLLQSDIDEFEDSLNRCMGMMAQAVNADRMYIWKNYEEDGNLLSTQLYEWSGGAAPQQGSKYTVAIPYKEMAPSFNEVLPSGRFINGLVRNMPQLEREHLEAQGILSILIVPVFLREQYWGFIGFDDCHSERVFSEDEAGILHSASLLISNAMFRNQMTLEIRDAVEAAQAASRAKSKFLSNMSHEIRTPINAITGMTLVGKSAAEAERKDYALGKIEEASNHLLGVINDILDMSKIEANKFTLSEVEFVFEKMLQKVVNVIYFRIEEKKQKFTVNLDNRIPNSIVGDDQRIAQVITNLLSNAVKFTPEEGSIRLDAFLDDETNGVCTIRIEVTDTGIGISEEQSSHLFVSFEQAEKNTTRLFGGTGLGLAISKHIVELMGGKIWILSDLGKGSKFAFTIKAKRGEEANRNPFGRTVSRNNIRVIVVDDEQDTREFFISMAEQLGITCETAAGGKEALELIKEKGDYDIYFIDWNMPGMNGVELSREIRALGSEKSIVVMISSSDWSVIEKDKEDVRIDKYLQKPLFPSAIADCINEYLGFESAVEAVDVDYDTLSFEGRRILLAEDVEINREIVISLLEDTGIEIDCASNGVEAVEMFRDAPWRYDLIFMDVQMPEMDGLEATRRIRSLELEKAAEIPIVAMTANVFKEDVLVCLEAGMSDHIGKPLDYDEMLSKLERYLK